MTQRILDGNRLNRRILWIDFEEARDRLLSMKAALPRLAILLLPFLLFFPGLSADSPPNVILLMGDDHGWDEVAYNGHPYLKTPILDEMASSGLRLDKFHTASPVCSPTRGSVITGRHPNRYGTFMPNWSTRPEEIGIAKLLKGAGYRTGHFGKWHLGPVKASSPTNPGAFGFDEWLSHDNFFELDPVLSRNGGKPRKYPGESSEIVIDETIRFIGETEKNTPFFAVVWFGSPHEPYMGLPEDLALYDQIPSLFNDRKVGLTSLETGMATTRPLGDVLRERYAEITAMDRAIGKLRDYLNDEERRGNTLLWYCGDNGVPSSGNATNPFNGLKGDVYEGGVRVPGVIEWPDRIRQNRISDLNTVTSDMLPTLCALAGQALPDRPLDGINLVSLLDGKMSSRPEPIYFWEYDTNWETSTERKPYIEPSLQDGTTPLVKQMSGKYTRSFVNFHHPVIQEADYAGPKAVLDNRYKLVLDGRRDSGIELFDLTNDPYETTDLSSAMPTLVESMKDQLREWQDSVLNSLTGADY